MSEQRIQKRLMGSLFELIVRAEDDEQAQRFLHSGIQEIQRIEDLFSEFKPDSEISMINQKAGISPVHVSDEAFQLLARCKHLYKITQGAFDITVGPLKKLYNFKNEDFIFPDKSKLNEGLSLVGSDKLELTGNNTVFLKKQGMKISLAAIGKGYAADKVKKKWLEMGVHSGVINASGDLTVIGEKSPVKPWIAGIPDPDNKEEMTCFVPLKEKAIATSGDYEQFFLHHGVRYSHNLNPKNGLPLTGIKSVSVVSPSAELSDAMATAVYVMGMKAGINLIDQLPETYCLIIDEDNKSHFSREIELVNA